MLDLAWLFFLKSNFYYYLWMYRNEANSTHYENQEDKFSFPFLSSVLNFLQMDSLHVSRFNAFRNWTLLSRWGLRKLAVEEGTGGFCYNWTSWKMTSQLSQNVPVASVTWTDIPMFRTEEIQTCGSVSWWCFMHPHTVLGISWRISHC